MSTPSETTSTAEPSAARVLVVDDETAICRIVCRTLERNGFRAISESNHEAVSDAIAKGNFDVVLLDRSMGPTDGSSLVPQIRSHAPSAKILFFTGEYVEADELKKVDGVVQKPVNGKELADTIRELL